MNLGKEPSDLPTETEKLRLMLAFMTIKEPARREQLLSTLPNSTRARRLKPIPPSRLKSTRITFAIWFFAGITVVHLNSFHGALICVTSAFAFTAGSRP